MGVAREVVYATATIGRGDWLVPEFMIPRGHPCHTLRRFHHDSATRPTDSDTTVDTEGGYAQENAGERAKGERTGDCSYKKRAEEAAEFGAKGLATRLETIVEDETSHYEETWKILKGW